MKDLIKVKDRHQRDIMTKKNVTGVGVGYKTTRGVKTDVLSIVVLVEKKLPAAALEIRDLVPRELEGIPTDVLEVGKFRTRNKPEKQRRQMEASPWWSVNRALRDYCRHTGNTRV